MVILVGKSVAAIFNGGNYSDKILQLTADRDVTLLTTHPPSLTHFFFDFMYLVEIIHVLFFLNTKHTLAISI